MSNFIFRGPIVDMKPHYLDDDTWQLVWHETNNIIFVGTKFNILKKYDEMNEMGVEKNESSSFVKK